MTIRVVHLPPQPHFGLQHTCIRLVLLCLPRISKYLYLNYFQRYWLDQIALVWNVISVSHNFSVRIARYCFKYVTARVKDGWVEGAELLCVRSIYTSKGI